MFEIIRRDGLARIGKFTSNSGKTMETPALFPVVNPKICTVSPRELYDTFGFKSLITNSYIIKNSKELNEKAREVGLHEMLDFPGIIDGVRGMKFIDAVCDSSEQGNVWKKI